jgi:hypothetical protein
VQLSFGIARRAAATAYIAPEVSAAINATGARVRPTAFSSAVDAWRARPSDLKAETLLIASSGVVIGTHDLAEAMMAEQLPRLDDRGGTVLPNKWNRDS